MKGFFVKFTETDFFYNFFWNTNALNCNLALKQKQLISRPHSSYYILEIYYC